MMQLDHHPVNCRRLGPQKGLTLIELMVAVAIAMVLALAIMLMMSASESRKRTTTSVNDSNQSGSYALYALDKLVRSAGSGFAQSADYLYGCKLFANQTSGAVARQLLPRTSNLPAPFATVSASTHTNNVFRLIPVLIDASATTSNVNSTASDALLIMSGTSGQAQLASVLKDFPAASTLTLANTMNYSAGDVVLVVDKQPNASGNISDCMVQQVAAGFAGGSGTSLSLGGAYYQATIDTMSLTSITDQGVVINMGNANSDSDGNVANPPAFFVIGVGDNATLFSYDLLQTAGAPQTSSVPIVDGIFEMHALYGVDTNGDGAVDTWKSPSTLGYTISSLTDGSATAMATLKTIKAIRVGLIMRTSLPERDAVVASTTLKLFSDLGSSLEYSRSLSSGDLNYRYRTLEATIPLRNALLVN